MFRIYRSCMCLSGLVAALLVVGCSSIEGTWMTCQFQPSLEKADFRISKATFYPNGSFESLAYKGDKTIKSKGVYNYNACSKDLMLMTGDKCMGYKAERVGENKLCVSSCSPEPCCMTTTAVMVRCGRCPPCLPCSPCCMSPGPCGPCARCP